MLLLTVLLSQSALALDRTSGSADLHFEGPTAYGYVGESSSTGDINGDGNSDILLGAPALGSLGSYGVVYLLSGPLGGYLWYGSTIAGWENDGLCHVPATAEVKLTGEDAYDYSGWSIAALGDLNQDGEEDIGVGAFGSERGLTNQGAAYVVLSSH